MLGSPVPVLTPGVQNVGRMGKKWNRRETEWIPAASGCGQMLGDGPGRKENGRRCRRMKMRVRLGSHKEPAPFGRGPEDVRPLLLGLPSNAGRAFDLRLFNWGPSGTESV